MDKRKFENWTAFYNREDFCNEVINKDTGSYIRNFVLIGLISLI